MHGVPLTVQPNDCRIATTYHLVPLHVGHLTVHVPPQAIDNGCLGSAQDPRGDG